MLFRLAIIAAIVASPVVAHAQGTQTQDTTAMGHTQSHMDSTTMTPRMRKSTKLHDTTAMGHNMTHKDSMSMKAHRDSMSMNERNYPKKMPPGRRDSSSMNVSPADSARVRTPSNPQMKAPPR